MNSDFLGSLMAIATHLNVAKRRPLYSGTIGETIGDTLRGSLTVQSKLQRYPENHSNAFTINNVQSIAKV